MASGDPQNFNHLTPAERFFVAKSRLSMTSTAAREVIRLNEQTKAVFSSALMQMTVPSRRGSAETLVRTIVMYEIVQICRLWDKFDASGFSLPTMGVLLRDREVEPLVRRELDLLRTPTPTYNGRLATLGRARGLLSEVDDEADSPRAEPEASDTSGIIEAQARALDLIFATESSDEVARLRNFRDKNIAHPLYRTRAEQRRAIDDSKQEDLHKVVDITVQVMPRIEAALTSTRIDYDELREDTRADANTFFDLFSTTTS